MDQEPKEKIKIKDMAMAFFFPLVIGKILILYFGTAYADHPGEGYGYGLVAVVTFTVIMVIRFLWRYRNYED